MSRIFVVMDYETRSLADLKSVGGFEYSMHPTTEIMCVAWRIGTKETLPNAPTYSWSQIDEDSSNLKKLIADILNPAHTLVAHNAFFEQVITRNVLSKYVTIGHLSTIREIKSIPHERWICTAARAAALALPRSLDGACSALGLQFQKDLEGGRLLLKMCKPRKPTKNNPAVWHETPEDYRRLVEYCRADIAAEVGLFLATPPLNETERRVWALDQKINFRGVYTDRHLVAQTLKMIEVETLNMTEELKELTDGQIDSVSQRDRMLRYLYNMGVRLPDFQAKTVTDAIASGEYTGKALRLLEIKRDFGKTSTAKYSAFWFRSKTDRRVRDSLLYHGASTGRWSGSGVQFQNLPRGSIKDTALSCKLVKDGDLDTIKMAYGNPMEVFSSNIRGCVIATPGKEIFCSDYAAIEARVLFWIAGHDVGCQMFADGIDLYKDMATKIYGVKLEDVIKDQRQLGKKAILGCGYGMGPVKFEESCEQEGITLEGEVVKLVTPRGVFDTKQLAVDAVKSYREVHSLVPELWDNLQRAAMYAVSNPSKSVTINRTKWFVKNDFLWCELPSGRRLAYYKPLIRHERDKFKNLKPTLYHYGINNTTRQWEMQKTWGGTLTENCLSGTTRVLTSQGVKKLINVTEDDLVFDGQSWVRHEGLICHGKKSVVKWLGVWLTSNHRIFNGKMFTEVTHLDENLKCGALQSARDSVTSLLNSQGWVMNLKHFVSVTVECFSLHALGPCLGGIRRHVNPAATYVGLRPESSGKGTLGLYPTKSYEAYGYIGTQVSYLDAQTNVLKRMRIMARGGLRSLNRGLMTASSSLNTLKTYPAGTPMVSIWTASIIWMGMFQGTLGSLADTITRSIVGPLVGFISGGIKCLSRYLFGTSLKLSTLQRFGILRMEKVRKIFFNFSNKKILVYDLVNTGPRHRFTILTSRGPVIVHNCVQAVARDFMADAMLRIEDAGYEVILSVHDELVAERKIGEGTLEEYESLMSTVPEWGKGCPIKVEGWVGKRYRK